MKPTITAKTGKQQSRKSAAAVKTGEKVPPARSVKGSVTGAVTDKKEKPAGDKTSGKSRSSKTKKVRARTEAAAPPAATSAPGRTPARKLVSPKKTAEKVTVEAKKPKAGAKAGHAGKLKKVTLGPAKAVTKKVKTAGKLPVGKKAVKSGPAVSEKEKKPSVRASSKRAEARRNSLHQPETESHPGAGHRTPIKEILSPELPEEYGENEFFLIPVEPRVVYASWEITKDSLPEKKGGLEVRFFEVTRGESGRSNTHVFLDIAVPKRVGDAFFNVGIHGREIVAEIGHRGADGHFRPLLRSRRVLIPSLLGHDELSMAAQSLETGIYGSRPPDK